MTAFLCTLRMAGDLLLYGAFAAFFAAALGGHPVPWILLLPAVCYGVSSCVSRQPVLRMACGAASLLGLLALPGWADRAACLPAAVYTLYLTVQGEYSLSANRQLDLFLLFCKVYPIFAVFLGIVWDGQTMLTVSLPLAIWAVLLQIFLMRVLRQQPAVYRDPVYLLGNAGLLVVLGVLGFLVSRPAVLGAAQAAVGAFYFSLVVPVLTIPLNLTLFIYSSAFKIFRKTGIIFLVSLGANLLNILLDYVLIFGHLGLPEMGTRGAALGTVTALAVNLGFYAFLGKDYVRFSRKDLSLEKMKQIFRFSLPFLGQETMEDILFVVGLNGIVARLGITELAAYNLIAQFINLILMPMFGYTAANTSLVSEWAGKGDRKQADKTGRYAFGLLCIWFAVFYMILVLGRARFARLISPDTEVIALAAACMPLALLIQLLNYYGNVWKSSLQSLGWQNWTLRKAFIINLLVLGFMGTAA